MDQRILNTKRALRASVFKLQKKKTLSEISVSELCKDAGVNRTTFYKHYQIPEDIYHEFIDEVYQEANSIFLISLNEGASLEDAFTQFFTFLYNNRKYFVMSSAMVGTLMDNLHKFTMNMKSLPGAGPFYTHFISGGIASMILLWSEHNYKESPWEMAQICIKIILRRL